MTGSNGLRSLVLSSGMMIVAVVIALAAWYLGPEGASAWQLIIVAVAAAGSMILWSHQRYQKPLDSLEAAVQTLVEGNATAEANLSGAEQLSAYRKDAMTRNTALADYCDRLGIGAAEVSFFLDQLRAGISQDRSSTENVSAAVADIRDGTEAITRSATETAQVANETSKAANSGLGIIQDTITKIREVADQVEHTATSMGRLQEASARIQGITSVINEVADQTNLLALNAAIEAARAGEHGRGFAVVAEEVRELAKKTTQATDEIAAVLQTISDESQNSGAVMTELRTRVNETVKVSSSVVDMLQAIVAQAHRSDSGIQDIAERMQQHLEAADRISSAVAELNDRLQETEAASEDTSGRALGLSEIAENMSIELAHLKLAEHHDRARQVAAEGAARVSKTFEEAIASGQLSEADIFDTQYQPIPNTDPPKFKTRYDSYADRVLPPIQEPLLDAHPNYLYAATQDRNGFVPSHNKRYCKPLTGDYKTDIVGNRNKRVFEDRTAVRCGSHTQPFLLQTYKRDTGDVLHDLSVPIYVNGRHWGAFRVGYKAETKA